MFNEEMLESETSKSLLNDIPDNYYRAVKYKNEDGNIRYKIIGHDNGSLPLDSDIHNVLEITKPFNAESVKYMMPTLDESHSFWGDFNYAKTNQNEWLVSNEIYSRFKDQWSESQRIDSYSKASKSSDYKKNSNYRVITENDKEIDNLFIHQKTSNNGSHIETQLKGPAIVLIILLIIFVKNYFLNCLAALVVAIIGALLGFYLVTFKNWDSLQTKLVIGGATVAIIFFIMFTPICETLGFAEKETKTKSQTVSSSYTSSSRKNGYVTTDGLNMRSGPSTDYYVVTVLSKGEKVIILESGDWCYISDGYNRGYVNSKFIEIAD